jgi:hypothetical protein
VKPNHSATIWQVCTRTGVQLKRYAGTLLLFLGAALVTAAIAVPTVLVPKLKVVPLDLDITTIAESVPAGLTDNDALPARVFDRCSINDPHLRVYNAHLTQQRRTVVVDPSSSDQVTLQSGQTVLIDRIAEDGGVVDLSVQPHSSKRDCNDGLLASSVDLVSIDRGSSKPNGQTHRLHTAEGDNGVATRDGDHNWIDAPRSGFQYHFGFDLEPGETYPYYDANSRTDQPARFVSETEVKGIKTYEFVSDVPEVDQTQLQTPSGLPALGSSVEMPARWWGIAGPGVDPDQPVLMHRYGKATRQVWVEPETGTVLFGQEQQHQYFRSPKADDPSVPAAIRDFQVDALNMTMAWTDATVGQQSSKAERYLSQLRLGTVWAPVATGCVGVILLLGGTSIQMRTRGHRSND